MINDKTAVIDVQFDMSEATTGTDEIKGMLEGLEEASNSFATSISNAFLSMLNSLKDVQSEIRSVAESLGEAVGKLSEVETPTETIDQAMCAVDGISAAYSAVKKSVKNYEELEKTSKSLGSPFAYLVLSNNMSELMKSMFPQTSVLAGMVGEWTNDMLLPNIVSGLNKISPSIGAGAEKMFGSITSAFGKVGTAIGNLSVGQGALIAVAIAAIVALVKLIVDNWDAIKAALGTAAEWFNTNIIQPIVGFFTGLWTSITNIVSNIWNGIVSVCTGVAQWVQDNVIQPVVGFFKTAFEWISTKLQAGFAFVQSIFTGISSFMQGVFAKDWTEQFGAFGNVLNAFLYKENHRQCLLFFDKCTRPVVINVTLSGAAHGASKLLGIPDRQCRIKYRGGGVYARGCMADAQQLTVLTAAFHRKLSPALNGTGGAALSGAVRKGGLGGPEYTNRTKSSPGGPHYEKILCPGIGPGGLDIHRHHWPDQRNYYL